MPPLSTSYTPSWCCSAMNRRALLLALALVGCGQGGAQCAIPMPPPRYDHPPIFAVRDFIVPVDTINDACRDMLQLDGDHSACSGRHALLGPINVLPAIDAKTSMLVQACARRHEDGHWNGWPADHRGAVTM